MTCFIVGHGRGLRELGRNEYLLFQPNHHTSSDFYITRIETRMNQKESEFVEGYPQAESMKYGTYPLHQEYMADYQRSLEASRMPDNDWRRPRFFHLVEMFSLTRGLPGATIEAGCFRGLSSHLICSTQRRVQPEYLGEDHVMVDSFEGLSKPVEKDGAFAASRYEKNAFTTTSLEHVQQTMAEFSETTILQGWIPEVFSQVPVQPYRFAHVDVDIYEPTKASLEFFFPLLVPGGILVVDDYGPWPKREWEGCHKAVQEFASEHQLPFAALDTGNAVFFKR